MISNHSLFLSIITAQQTHWQTDEELHNLFAYHYRDLIMSPMASQITSLTIVYSTVYPGADQRKHQSSASLALVRGIHKGPVMRKMLSFDDVIMGSDFTFIANQCMMINLSPHGQIGRHFADDIFKRIFLNEKVWFLTKISLKLLCIIRYKMLSFWPYDKPAPYYCEHFGKKITTI